MPTITSAAAEAFALDSLRRLGYRPEAVAGQTHQIELLADSRPPLRVFIAAGPYSGEWECDAPALHEIDLIAFVLADAAGKPVRFHLAAAETGWRAF